MLHELRVTARGQLRGERSGHTLSVSRLEEVDTQAASVVQLRYFTGLAIEETAAALGISTPTVKRAWAFARGWLR